MKKEIMTSANVRAKKEGRSTALKKSHRAAKGCLVAAGKVRSSLRQVSRLTSNFTPGKQIESVIVNNIDLDFGSL